MTITFTVTIDTRDQIAAAFVAHAADERMGGALGRIKKSDHPLMTANLMRHWPADADGLCRILLNDVAGTLVWRAMAIADMAAGRDIRSDLAGRLGVRVEDAFVYVRKNTYSRGIRCNASTVSRGTDRYMAACARLGLIPSERHPDGRRHWTVSTQKIITGGLHCMFDGGWNLVDPDLDSGDSANHIVMYRTGFLLEPTIVDGRMFRPRASSLFLTPVPDPVVVTLSAADEDALELLAA